MKQSPGSIRDIIFRSLAARPRGATTAEIARSVSESLGDVRPSSVRSYLALNTPRYFVRADRGTYRLRDDLFDEPGIDVFPPRAESPSPLATFHSGNATLVHADCLGWLANQPLASLHAVVTDPPYGLVEYSDPEKTKLRSGKGGVWRIPPAFDGAQRSPLPRFTTLTQRDLIALDEFFYAWAKLLLPRLVPGANVVVAANPLLSHVVSGALARAGLERRGEIVRLVMTMRGGDRPKSAHEEFSNVSVMPRSMWEPWVTFRRPLEGRAQDNLRKWGTGGFRRPSAERPFGDVITSAPTRANERKLAPHPSLKPQAFMRQLVRACLPLGRGIVCDPFAGSGSTLAAAEAVGYRSIGVEKDPAFYAQACAAIPKLAALKIAG